MGVRVIPSERHSRKMRVAAYVRVSTLMEEQETSFEAQMEHYEKFIKDNPEWEFAGVFGEKLSGTHSVNRGDFNRMIKAALDREIDLIYCKSVSRWARNTVKTLDTINLLTGNQVHVIFEQEGIDTRNPGVFFQLSLAASVAQCESETISENMKWVYNNRAEQGIFIAPKRKYFGYNTDDGKFTPDENAKYVRMIFERYVDGAGLMEIVDELNGLGVKTQRGVPFTINVVRGILMNEKYVGDVRFGKVPRRNVITGKLDEYQIDKYLENHHEGIVSRELWNRVQKRMGQGKEKREIAAHRKERILNLLRADPWMKTGKIAERIGATEKEVKNYILALKGKGLIRREGKMWVVTS